MRPMVLRMNCFGPFFAETVDFTRLNRELFLITGPTGSGKTTIFDGICYALYGESSSQTRAVRDMKSHFADEEALMSVDFTFALGAETYRVVRIPEQQRKKQRGEGLTTQKSEAQLYRVTNHHPNYEEKLLESDIKGVDGYISELLGMGVGEFRQIVMLPQGEFSKLLQSNEKERTALLKSIFRFDIFKAFGKKIEEEMKTCGETLSQLKTRGLSEIDHIDFSDDDRIVQMSETEQAGTQRLLSLLAESLEKDEKRLRALNEDVERQKINLEQINGEIRDGEELARHFDELAQKRTERENLEDQRPVIAEIQKTLNSYQQALRVKPHAYAAEEAENAVAKQQAAADKAREAAEHGKAALENLRAEYEAVMSEAWQQETAALTSEQESLEELLNEMKGKEELTAQKKIAEEQKKSLEARMAKAKAAAEEKEQEQQRYRELEKQELTLQNEITEKSGKLDGFNRQLRDIDDIQSALTALDGIEKRLEAERKQYKTLKSSINAEAKELRRLKEKEKNQRASQLAKDLTSGSPCPVCGSVHHPHPAERTGDSVDENVLEARDEALSRKKETLLQLQERGHGDKRAQEEEKKKLQKAMARQLNIEVAELRKDMWIPAYWTDKHKATAQNCKVLADVLEAGKNQLTNIRRETELLQKKIAAKTPDSLENAAEEREQLTVNIAGLNGQMITMDARIAQIVKQWPAAGDDRKSIQIRKDELSAKLEKRRVHQQEITRDYTSCKEKMAGLSATLDGANAACIQAIERREKMTEAFDAALKKEGLSKEVYAQRIQLSRETIAAYEQKVSDYKSGLDTLATGIETLLAKIGDARPVDLPLLFEKRDEAQKALETCQEQSFRLAQKQTNNKKQQDVITALYREEQAAESTLGVYKTLNDAIAGKVKNRPKISLERYILSAYLADILQAANLFLSKMSSGRYRLELAGDEITASARGLAIDVLDAYTGQRRSANTLSGGETFMAALSMALGLSDTVQASAGGISLETIFIDEGFSTLDPEALDAAINCLLSINESGRSVGLISHVEELKERIDTKIEIIKTDTGSHIEIDV